MPSSRAINTAPAVGMSVSRLIVIAMMMATKNQTFQMPSFLKCRSRKASSVAMAMAIMIDIKLSLGSRSGLSPAMVSGYDGPCEVICTVFAIIMRPITWARKKNAMSMSVVFVGCFIVVCCMNGI